MSVYFRCVSEQLLYLILNAIQSDDHYKQQGINARDLQAILAENAKIWGEVGVIREGKSFLKRLRWSLSQLVKLEALYCKGKSQYGAGSRFDELMAQLVEGLVDKLQLELDYSHLEEQYQKQLEANPDLFIPALAAGHIAVETLESVSDRKVHLFTHQQVMKLAEQSVQYRLTA